MGTASLVIFRQALGPGTLRLFLAGLVMVSHLSALNVGEPAVFVFFILSGYWVSLMYLHKYPKFDQPIRAFYLSRVLRIWPPYVAAVLFSIVGMSILTDAPMIDFWPSFLLVGVASHGIDALNIAWALDIELQFYFSLPLLIPLCRLRSGALVFGTSLIAAVFGWWLFLETGLKTLLCYLPLFVAGLLLAARNVSFGSRVVLASGLGFCVLLAFFIAIPTLRAFFLKTQASPFNEEWMTMALILLLVPVIWKIQKTPASWLDTHLGNLSYCVYLLHFPLKSMVEAVLGGGLNPLEKLIFSLAVLVISVFFYLVIDRSSEALRRAVMRRQAHGPKLVDSPKTVRTGS